MTTARDSAGYFRSGLPYNRLGHGPRIAVVFQGLMFENRPLSRLSALGLMSLYRFLKTEYTTYVVNRRPGLPSGYSLANMADDYASMIDEEFDGPVDVIGTSTGGSIAHHFAADHSDKVRRLVIHSSAYTLSAVAKQAQLEIAHLAREGNWREANAVTLRLVLEAEAFSGPLVWLASSAMSIRTPDDPSDLIVTVEAEDQFDFKDRLREISMPTLVVAGRNDPFYTEKLFCGTASSIPDARLILYPDMGHPARGKQFQRDVLRFLTEQ